MIFAPSPQALLHGNHPNYEKTNSYFSFANENPNLTEQQYQDLETALIDINLLHSSNSTKPALLAYFQTIISMGSSLKYEKKAEYSPYNLFFGLLSLQCGDIENAIHFINFAAEKGDICAINLLANLHFFYIKFCETEASNEIVKKCLTSTFLNHSIDSLFHLGNVYTSSNCVFAIHFFYQHFRETNSNLSILKICDLLNSCKFDDQLAKKMMLFSISLGEPKFIEHFINELKSIWLPSFLIPKLQLWENTISNYYKILSLPDRSNQLSLKFTKTNKKINTDINSNFDFNSSPYIDIVVKPISIKILDMHPHSILYQTSINQNSILYSNLSTDSKTNIYIPFYPSNNKTNIIFHIFELTSSDFKKRNLKLAEKYLSELYNFYPNGILSSEIFKLRSNSSNHKWVTSCGFIYLLLGDIDNGYKLFLKASTLGNLCATMMCGFLLFHWDNNEEERKKKACVFFLKCTTDPVALIHLFFILDDISMLDRACSIIDNKSRIKTIFWLVNLLIEGIKMPSLSICPAKMICIAAIEFGTQNNEDTTDVYDCYLRHFQ